MGIIKECFQAFMGGLRRDPLIYPNYALAYTLAETLEQDFGISVIPIGVSLEMTSLERECDAKGNLIPKGTPTRSGWMYYGFNDKLTKFNKLKSAEKILQYTYTPGLRIHLGAKPKPGLFALQTCQSDFAIEVPKSYLESSQHF